MFKNSKTTSCYEIDLNPKKKRKNGTETRKHKAIFFLAQSGCQCQNISLKIGDVLIYFFTFFLAPPHHDSLDRTHHAPLQPDFPPSKDSRLILIRFALRIRTWPKNINKVLMALQVCQTSLQHHPARSARKPEIEGKRINY